MLRKMTDPPDQCIEDFATRHSDAVVSESENVEATCFAIAQIPADLRGNAVARKGDTDVSHPRVSGVTLLARMGITQFALLCSSIVAPDLAGPRHENTGEQEDRNEHRDDAAHQADSTRVQAAHTSLTSLRR